MANWALPEQLELKKIIFRVAQNTKLADPKLCLIHMEAVGILGH
jgi:hypothetical protein